MSTSLIVNADELGLTEQVNRAIIEAHEAGVVTSATMIVNMWAFDDAVALAGCHPGLGVGAHLNLTDGIPVSLGSRRSTLVSPDGSFFNRGALLSRLSAGRMDAGEVEYELRAQVARCAEAGITLTHLDCHQHVHLHPRLLPVVAKIAREMRLPLRLPEEWILRRGGGWSPLEMARYARKRVAVRLARRARRLLWQSGVLTTDHFRSPFGLFPARSPVTCEDFTLLVEGLPPGVTELMVHPGYVDERLRRFSVLSEHREDELRAIVNPRFIEGLRRSGVNLVHYGFLNSA